MQKYNWLFKSLKFYKNYKLVIFTLGLCVLSSSVLFAFFPFLQSIMIDSILLKNIRNLSTIFLLYLFLWVSYEILQFMIMGIWSYLHTKVVFDIRLLVFKKILRLKAESLTSINTGDMISRINYDTDSFADLAFRLTNTFLVRIPRILLIIIIIFNNSWQIGLLMIIIIPLITFTSKFFANKLVKNNAELTKKHGMFIAWILETLKGVIDIKLFAGQKNILLNFYRKQKNIIKLSYKSNLLNHKSNLSCEFILLLFTLITYIILSFTVYFNIITIGAFVAILKYIDICKSDFVWLNETNNVLKNFQVRIERIFELLEKEEESFDKLLPNYIFSKGNICFKNVSFKYEEREIIKDLSFEINSPISLALVGKSGVGKSTIISLILRFYKCNEGKIMIDNFDILNCNVFSIRKNIGVVQQQVMLFDDTIRNNLRIVKRNATEDELINACKKANIYALISSLNDGFDTHIRNNGDILSGGEKQRLSIARIFLKDPNIIILDEATASLDYDNEDLLFESWNELKKDRIIIIISHRIRSIEHADNVFFINDHHLIIGEHKELLSENLQYKNLLLKENSDL